MARIWRGAISFGLVNIPISLVNGMNRQETVRFHLLRKSDHSRIHNKRIAEADDEEVAKDEIVKGYEYEKDKYVEVDEEDLERVAIKSTHTIDIQSFVPVKDIKPAYFCEPYFIQPEKGGEKAFRLLTEVLQEKKMAGISKVVFRGGREHLVALIPDRQEAHRGGAPFRGGPPALRHDQPAQREGERAGAGDGAQAGRVDGDRMESPRLPDEYEKALHEMLKDKVAGKKPARAPKKEKRPDNVIDLVEVLQKSLRSSGKGGQGFREEDEEREAGGSPCPAAQGGVAVPALGGVIKFCHPELVEGSALTDFHIYLKRWQSPGADPSTSSG